MEVLLPGMLTDTHCHLEDLRYDSDREKVIDDNLKELVFAVNIAENLKSFEPVLSLAAKYDKIFACLGVHPHHALTVTPEAAGREINKQLAQSKLVGIGECGLDYYFRGQDLAGRTEYEVREAQKKLFEAQIDLAKDNNLPLVVHCRDNQDGWDAYQDCLEIIKGKGIKAGVIHSFSGDLQFADSFIEQGFYLGISGILTFDKTGRLEEVIKETSIDNLVLETDSPYLAPVPHRGQRNEPKYTKFIAEKIAEIKNTSLEEVLQVTEANARKLFGIRLQ